MSTFLPVKGYTYWKIRIIILCVLTLRMTELYFALLYSVQYIALVNIVPSVEHSDLHERGEVGQQKSSLVIISQ